MKDSYTTRALIGAMNLFAVSAPVVASEGSERVDPVQDQAALNATSLKSIESSWLEVPATCKARGFNAAPIALDIREPGIAATHVYASFGA